MSRIGAGKIELRWQHVDLTTVIENAVDAVRPTADALGISVCVDMAPDDPVRLEGDEARLRQVVLNLLGNALKFTQGLGRVSVALRRDERELTLTVRDSGRGIPPHLLPYVFERLWQASGAGASSPAGMGIGLSIVREVVEMHGVTVRVDSEGNGQGATFTVILPLQAHYLGGERPGARRSGRPWYSRSELARRRVLVVDNDNGSRTRAVCILEAAGGAEVVACANANEALTRVRAAHRSTCC